MNKDQKMDITFPQRDLICLQFKDIKQLRNLINAEARQTNNQVKRSWFHIAGQDEHYTYMRCQATHLCKAFIKLLYVPQKGFIVQEVQNKHCHDKNNEVQQLKKHHILSPFLENFVPSRVKKTLDDGVYVIKTNCCCKDNPGTAAIAYQITNSKGEVVIQNSKKLQDSTNNKAQFTVVMCALMDCFENGIKRLEVRNRSKLIVDFMNNNMKISSPSLRSISEAAKLLSTRIGSNVSYRVIDKHDSSIKLQNMCRKLLELRQIQTK